MNERVAVVSIALAVASGAAMAWGGGRGGPTFAGVPTFWILVAAVFYVQWLAFLPAYVLQTEAFFDLTGSLTFITAAPALEGWQHATLASPVFVALLLTRVSGVPTLERAADERWGGDPSYEDYKRSTPVLVPRPPSA